MKKTAVLSLLLAVCMMLSVFGGTFTSAFAQDPLAQEDGFTEFEDESEDLSGEDGEEEEAEYFDLGGTVSVESLGDDETSGLPFGEVGGEAEEAEETEESSAVESSEAEEASEGSEQITTFGDPIIRPLADLTVGLNITPIGNHLQMGWNLVSSATDYKVFRSKSASGTFIDVGDVEQRGTQNPGFIDPFLEEGTLYYYYIEAYNGSSLIGTSETVACTSEAFINDINLEANAVTGDPSKITLTWEFQGSALDRPQQYEVFMAENPEDLYNHVDTVMYSDSSDGVNFEYTVDESSFQPGSTYYFGVMVIDPSGVNVFSTTGPVAGTTSDKPKPPAPQNLQAEATSSSQITVTWEAANHATKYVLYVQKEGEASFTEIEVGNVLTYDHIGLESNTEYTYYVVGYNDTVKGEDSNQDSARTKLKASDNLDATTVSSTEIKIVWDAVDDATSYDLYYKKATDTDYSVINLGNVTEHNHIGLTPDTEYTYYVVGKNNLVDGDPSNTDTAKTSLDAPTNVDAQGISSSEIKVTWEQVTGATKYIVYYDTDPSGSFTGKVGEASLLEITHTGLPSNTTYYYKVSAVSAAGEGAKSAPADGTTLLPAPENVVTEPDSDTSIKIEWDKVDDADGYYVYRKDPNTGDLDEIGKITDPDQLEFIDTGLQPDTEYEYVVSGYVDGGDEGEQSPPVTGKTKLPAPGNVKAEGSSSTTIDVTWNAVTGATGYEVLRSDSLTGPYLPVGSVTAPELKLIDRNLTPDTTYYYKVQATRGTETGEPSDPAEGTTLLPAPENVKATPNDDKITVTWDTVPNAEEYVVEYSKDPSGPFTSVTVTDPEFIHTGLGPDETYYYQVTAKKDDKPGDTSDQVNATTNPNVPSNLIAEAVSSSEIQLTWDEVDSADSYVVYRKNPVTGNFEPIKTVTDPEYLDTGLTPNTEYEYTVAAVKKGQTGKQSSPAKDKTLLPAPENVVAEPGEEDEPTVIIEWDPVKDADGYYVYRKDPGGNWEYVGETDVPNYEDRSPELEHDTEYEYKVVAKDDKDREGDPSDEVEVTTNLPATQRIDAEAVDHQSIEVDWDAIPNAEGYVVYRSESASGPYAEIDRVGKNDLSLLDEPLTPGVKYYYKVAGIKNNVIGAKSQPADATTPLGPVVNVETDPLDDTRIKVTWDPKTDADSYIVYIEEPGGNLVEVGTTPDTETIVTGLDPNTEYTFVVTPVKDGKEGQPSAPVTDKTMLSAPDDVYADPVDDTTVNVTWEPVDGADDYLVEYSKNPAGPWTAFGETPDTELDVTGLDPDTVYYFRVTGQSSDNTGVPSDPADARTLLPQPQNVKAKEETPNEVTVTWNAVPGATEYMVERATHPDGPYGLVDYTSDTELLDDTVQTDTDYYYRVTAYSPDNESLPSLPAHVKTKIPVPQNITATAVDHQSIRVDWTALPGVEGYFVYRCLTADGVYVKIGEASSNTYLDSDLDPGVTYYYKVASHKAGNVSELSNYAYATTHDAPYTLRTPSCFTACALTAQSIKLKHSKVTGALGYTYYRSDSKYGPWEKIGTSPIPQYIDEGLKANTKYYYKVDAYHDYGISKQRGPISCTTKNVTMLTACQCIDAKAENAYTLRVRWHKQSTAIGYKVYRSETYSGGYTMIGMTSDTQYLDNSLEPSTTYYYYIVPYNDYTIGYDSNIVTGTTHASKTLAKPSSFDVKAKTAYMIELDWNMVKGAEGYNVYRARSENGPFELIADVVDDSSKIIFQDDELDPLTTYYYKVAAYNLQTEGDFTSVKKDKTKEGSYLKKPSRWHAHTVDDTMIRLDWNAVAGAIGYRIYRSNSRNGVYVEIADVSVLSYVDKNLHPYTKYYYKCEAYDQYYTGPRTSAESAKTKKPIILKKPSGLSVSDVDYQSIGLKWSYVTGATQYNIYMATSEYGDYELVGETADKQFKVTGLKPSTTYFFKVEPENSSSVGPMAGPKKDTTKKLEPLKKPSSLSTKELNAESIRVSWSSVAGADGYIVYRSLYKDSGYVQIGTTDENVFIDEGLQANTKYYYCVQAYNAYTESEWRGPSSDTTKKQ